MNKINKDVKDSLSQLYNDNTSQSSTCTLLFTEPKPAHEVVLKRVLYQINDNNTDTNNYDSNNYDNKNENNSNDNKINLDDTTTNDNNDNTQDN